MRGCGRQSGKQHLKYLNVKAVWIKTGQACWMFRMREVAVSDCHSSSLILSSAVGSSQVQSFGARIRLRSSTGRRKAPSE
jgi:hypothetical protein